MPRALVLRHHNEDRPGLIGDALVERGFDLDVVMFPQTYATTTLDGFDIVVILGSTSSVYHDDIQQTWFGAEIALIEEANRRHVPVLGICFGAQALCISFGGSVEPAKESEVGWFPIDVEPNVALSPGPWFEFHYDHCILPEHVELWAKSARAVQAFAYGNNVGVQFHPEVDDEQLGDWFSSDEDIARNLDIDLDALLAQTKKETPAARLRAAALVELFLHRVGLVLS